MKSSVLHPGRRSEPKGSSSACSAWICPSLLGEPRRPNRLVVQRLSLVILYVHQIGLPHCLSAKLITFTTLILRGYAGGSA